MSFTKLVSRFSTADRTARFALASVAMGGDAVPVLIAKFAGESNAPYMNAVFKAVNDGKPGPIKASLTRIAADREEDAKLFAAHVLVDWENVPDDSGTTPAFTADVAEKFLLELAAAAPEVFDAFRRFCRNAENFRGPQASPEDLGKG